MCSNEVAVLFISCDQGAACPGIAKDRRHAFSFFEPDCEPSYRFATMILAPRLGWSEWTGKRRAMRVFPEGMPTAKTLHFDIPSLRSSGSGAGMTAGTFSRDFECHDSAVGVGRASAIERGWAGEFLGRRSTGGGGRRCCFRAALRRIYHARLGVDVFECLEFKS
jgi:hypothetical protein